MSSAKRLALFEGFGVELEYMVVRRDTLDVAPIADELFKSMTGDFATDVVRDRTEWSNELVAHVVEMKTGGPAPRLEDLAPLFHRDVVAANAGLAPLGARLMPGAVHPWMDPHRETRLWDHEYTDVYRAYDRIFNCSGHGWANVQSTHLNLPFADDEQFGLLHAAIRVLLPILPALAASSPIIGGAVSRCDTRLQFYRTNQARVPSITGRVIPEPIFTEADYRREIFERIWRDIAPLDPDGILQGEEFLNSRGAIARFSRGAIEIRVLDIQECPAADLAILEAVVAVLRRLTEGTIATPECLRAWAVEPLERILLACIESADLAVINDSDYLALWAAPPGVRTAGELWRHLVANTAPHLVETGDRPMAVILREGTLARRLVAATGPQPTRPDLHRVYGELCDCLAQGRMFRSTPAP